MGQRTDVMEFGKQYAALNPYPLSLNQMKTKVYSIT
jgi:hypothetical protein